MNKVFILERVSIDYGVGSSVVVAFNEKVARHLAERRNRGLKRLWKVRNLTCKDICIERPERIYTDIKLPDL